MIRFPQRLFLFYARMRRGMTLGVRGVVFDAEGRVFLVRHGYTPGWHFPGGGVEVGETLHTALARELEEEGGIVLTGPADLFGMYLGRRFARRDHVAAYVCRSWNRVREPEPGWEIAETGFFAPDALPEGTTGPTRRRLAEIVDGAPVSPDW